MIFAYAFGLILVLSSVTAGAEAYFIARDRASVMHTIV
jgi:hypothetical protein